MDFADAHVPPSVLPTPDQLKHAQASIHKHVPGSGLGLTLLGKHLQSDILPSSSKSSDSSRYYGFVTGGALPAAVVADNAVTQFDQNVQVHSPNETIATELEHHALNSSCESLDLDPQAWSHKTFTTGATASNVVGLACGREYVIAEAARRVNATASVARDGLGKAMRLSGVDDVQILSSVPHSSVRKAASVIGLGHSSVRDVSLPNAPHRLDLSTSEKELARSRTVSIILISCSEVNTGLFATDGLKTLREIRRSADQYGAWIHVDGAFGLLCRALPDGGDLDRLKDGVRGLELADSLTGDGHKLLNVPYDCGFIISRHLSVATQVFQNPGAPYLQTSPSDIPSPSNIGIENSRRFRALPVYANSVAYGRDGYRDMLERQIRLARKIAEFIDEHDAYELSPALEHGKRTSYEDIFIIVLFRAKRHDMNTHLVQHINSSRQIYISGTAWGGQPAARFAVSNWKVDETRDWPVIRDVLEEAAHSEL